MTKLEQLKITELKELQEQIINYIRLSIKNGYDRNIIKNKEKFRHISHCIYTSQILSLCSGFNIRVVEGITVDENNNKHYHCWNEFKGFQFNLINDNHNFLKHYGVIISKEELKKHLINNTSDTETTFKYVKNIIKQ
jgi:hypothetical protein